MWILCDAKHEGISFGFKTDRLYWVSCNMSHLNTCVFFLYIYISDWITIFYAYHHVVQEQEDVLLGRDQWDKRWMDWLCDRLSRIIIHADLY